MQTKLGIIGAGNMGSSLISGLLRNQFPAECIWVSDPNQEKLDLLRQQYRIHSTQDNLEVLDASDTLILAIKPQKFNTLAEELAPNLQLKKKLILSVMAGVPTQTLEKKLALTEAPIIRAMPNTASFLGCGATALFANSHVSAEMHQFAESLMRALGMTIWVQDETLMSTVTALSGSGPAYFFLMMEAMEAAAIELGLPASIAHALSIHTALGASRMAIESNQKLEQLRLQVTSPGGTTERAISVLESRDIRGIFKAAIKAAKLRSDELASS